MNSVDVNNISLLFTFGLVLVAILISYWQKLELSRDIIYSVARAVIQLTLVGYVLKYIFKMDNALLTLLMVLFIITNAAWNAHKRNPNKTKKFFSSFIAVFISTSITLGVLLLTQALKLVPSQIIPITGMIASNCMVAIGLCYRTMNTQFDQQEQQILEMLSLGATPRQASDAILRASIKTAMQPTVDSAKTVGLVSLPGMMSGLIFAGIDPVHAIRYQIMVTFMLLSTTSIGAFIAGYRSYRDFYNSRDQLISR